MLELNCSSIFSLLFPKGFVTIFDLEISIVNKLGWSKVLEIKFGDAVRMSACVCHLWKYFRHFSTDSNKSIWKILHLKNSTFQPKNLTLSLLVFCSHFFWLRIDFRIVLMRTEVWISRGGNCHCDILYASSLDFWLGDTFSFREYQNRIIVGIIFPLFIEKWKWNWWTILFIPAELYIGTIFFLCKFFLTAVKWEW